MKTNKLLILTIAFALILLISLIGVNAYSFQPDLYPVYNYYEENWRYDNIPVVTGPYPRGYLWHRDAYNNNRNTDFLYDDFNHYDDFIGYRDLDVFYSDGRVDVIRNPSSRQLDLSQIPSDMQTFGKHVYGVLPDGSVYRKHYDHDHSWDLGPSYGYYTPFSTYRNMHIYRI